MWSVRLTLPAPNTSENEPQAVQTIMDVERKKKKKERVAGAEPVGGEVRWRWAAHLDRKHRGEKQELEVSLTKRSSDDGGGCGSAKPTFN